MASPVAPRELPAASDDSRPPAAVDEEKLPAEEKTEGTEGTEQTREEKTTTQDNSQADDSDAPSSPESGETSSPKSDKNRDDAPPLPNEAPPLPAGPPPVQDDGWDFHWDATNQAYFFHNRFTGATTWENPRTTAPAAAAAGAPGTSSSAAAAALSAPPPLPTTRPVAGGYNPAIHGDYDPNAWYAQAPEADAETTTAETNPAALLDHEGHVAASFNRFTGQFQRADEGPDRHTDEAKSKRQMNAFFDVDAAANAHDGRSLKAERSGKKISKSELKHFKEKRKARKEEKRRAWLRD
jgi:hypothetical protein